MCNIRIIISKALLGTLIAFSAFFPQSGVWAAGTTEPTGPQQPTGITEATGVTGSTGVTEATGPTEPTGVTEPSATTTNFVSSDNAGSGSVVSPVYSNLNDNDNEGSLENSLQTNSTPAVGNGSGSSSSEIAVQNTVDIDNNISYDLNTGGNSISNNTVAGNVNTGDITGTVNLLNIGNSVLGEGSSFNCQNILAGDGDIILETPNNAVDISGVNVATGPESNNGNQYANNNIVAVFENNSASANNVIEIDADTGNNTVSNNSYLGDITTGDINLGVNLFNILNVVRPDLTLAIDVWNILGDVNGDITLANNVTGAHSDNENNITSSQDTSVSITQNADLNNSFGLNLNTGDNNIGANTAIGDVSTGNVDARNTVANIANIGSPMYVLLNVFGDWDGDYGGLDPNYVIVNVINQQAGTESNNVNTIAGSSDTDITINNDATANNQISVNANTGRNTISNNTVLGKLASGGIKLSDNVVNIANSFDENVTKFALKIINIFGNWKHKHGDGKGGGGDGGGGGSDADDSSPNDVPPVAVETLPDVISNSSGQHKSSLGLRSLPAAGSDQPIIITGNSMAPKGETSATNISVEIYAICLLSLLLLSAVVTKRSLPHKVILS